MLSTADELERTTFRLEQLRAVAGGALESVIQTFLVLIAVAVFDTTATAKALLVMSVPVGLLLSPVLLAWVRIRGWRVASAAGVVMYVSGACMLVGAAFPILALFIPASMLAFMGTGLIIPLTTKLYRDNYPHDRRGVLFSKSVVVRIVAAAFFAWLGGVLLADDLSYFRYILAGAALAFFYSGFCLVRCPSQPVTRHAGQHPFHALSLVRSDRVLRWTLVSWMFMGVGNLVMLPLRVEYLANPVYSIALTPATVALLTGVIPNLSRLVMSRVWGSLFDRMNFFLLRIVLNVGFILGILTFFLGESTLGFVVGALVFGISVAGGDIAWSLWVTKIAPPDKVADYMSVHTFFTGVRGLVAPFLAFHLIQLYPVTWLALGCAASILIGSLLLVPEVKSFHRRRPGQPLVPESKDV